ncbi:MULTISPECIES: LysE family transporter [unclassified Microbacterium]|uniref:LysE family transporter n=1 Tax=unclassified Microbacterium TaxID=2609290 RepID=UPI000EA8891E|nr:MULTISPECIES: LysE family transporter [unclassified Microbacterium]MBT2485772.1 LysE family transporter [Microbacterium sp. ISL-108]RKN68535.1 lysine transporter LysE [Microbacterium sp. CGR2]
MSLAVWFSLLTASVVISFTPGAGAINTMSNALNEGWRRSIWGIIGQQIALVVHVAIVAAGLGLLVSRSEVLFNGIRYAGAAYLVFLGIRLILTKPIVVLVDDDIASAQSREGRWSMIRRGFWVNLLNPKAIVFFLAFIPQFIRLDEAPVPQYLTLVATVIVVDVLVMWGFFATAARPFRRLTRSARGQRTLNAVFGTLFIAVAALLVFMH